MSRVVCCLTVDSERATFIWSEGPASFAPYTLKGPGFEFFEKTTKKLRETLSHLVQDCLESKDSVPEDSYALAKTGHDLYKQIFTPGRQDRDKAKLVRVWLEALRDDRDVETLEIVVDGKWTLPWNVIYDLPPDKEAFLSGNEDGQHWKPFWGIRYNLTGGKKVDPRYRLPSLKQPRVLFVVDPTIRAGLPVEEQQRLNGFVAAHQSNVTVVSSEAELEAEVEKERPDLLYWMSHAEPTGLTLGDDEVTPTALWSLLSQSEEEEFGGLAFLNACQTAEAREGETSFFDVFHDVGFSGMIGTEQRTIDTFANPLGIEFLEALLDRGEAIGTILHRLRRQVPLGLVYGAYCPPHIHVEQDSGSSADTQVVNPVSLLAGTALGGAGVATRKASSLPSKPYRSLTYYERNDRALFAGRDDDIKRFARLLNESDTRVLLLHGGSGVGKSSFLRAGVIPYLEEDCVGYQFLRECSENGKGRRPDEESVLFIRATNDLCERLAQALYDYCAQPYEYRTPIGDLATADLPTILATELGQAPNPQALRTRLHNEPGLLGRLLSVISRALPFSPVLIIDQCEEIFTLADSWADEDTTKRALGMLRRTVAVDGDFKIILALRTEFHGRVTDGLRRGLRQTHGLCDYLLTDFDVDQLVDAIERPTQDGWIPFTTEVPYEKYQFKYAPGVARQIAKDVRHFSTQQRDSVLPLLQVICNQLYEVVCQREERCITADDFRQTIGGVEGGMRSHVDRMVHRLVHQLPGLTPSEVKSLFAKLYNEQTDGSVTTALLGEEQLSKQWQGRVPLNELLRSAEQLRLLRVSTFRVGPVEQRRVSLGHDALAKIAAAWAHESQRAEDQRRARRKLMMVASVAVFMMVVAASMVGLAIAAQNARDTAEAEKVRAEHARDGALSALNLSLDLGLATERKGLPLEKALDVYQGIATEVDKLSRQHPDNLGVRTLRAKGLNAVGRIHDVRGDYVLARDLYEKAKKEREAITAANPTNVEYQRLLASSWMNLGQLGGKEQHAHTPHATVTEQLQTAQRIRREQLAIATGDDVWRLQRDLGMGCLNLGKLALDEPTPDDCFNEAVAVFRQLIAEGHADSEIRWLLAASLRLLGDHTFRQSGDAVRAQELYSQALEGIDTLSQGDPTNRKYLAEKASLQFNLGTAKAVNGNSRESLAEFEAAFQLYGQLFSGQDYPANDRLDYAAVLRRIAMHKLANGQLDEAYHLTNNSLQLLEALNEEFPSNERYRLELSDSRLLQGIIGLNEVRQGVLQLSRQHVRKAADDLIPRADQVPDEVVATLSTLGSLVQEFQKQSQADEALRTLDLLDGYLQELDEKPAFARLRASAAQLRGQLEPAESP